MDKFVVHETSMGPTLRPGDRLLASGRTPAVGEIVVVPQPGNPTTLLVKRMVAGPGWEVRMLDARLEVTGPDGVGAVIRIPAQDRSRIWSLADDEMFVLSDAAAVTLADSRTFGPVPIATARTIVFRYAPLSRMGALMPPRCVS